MVKKERFVRVRKWYWKGLEGTYVCLTGMGTDMGKEMGNVSQKEREKERDHRTGILMKKKNEEWRKVKSGGKWGK